MTAPTARQTGVQRLLRTDFVRWLLLYGLLWVLLSGAQGWLFGAVCAAAASLLSLALSVPVPRCRLRALPRLLGFFVWEMALGGWDVARRVLDPKLPVAPIWVAYPLVHTHPRRQMLLGTLVGIMPGTLASRIVDNRLRLHILDQGLPWQRTLAQLEQHLNAFLGEAAPEGRAEQESQPC